MFDCPVTLEISIDIFNVTSRAACTLGVMSMFTPTSKYWNCVLTRGLMPTPPIPGWNEPVATGTRSPIFSEAFCPSTARICGFWMSFVLLSENKAVAVAGLIVTAKSVAFRLPRRFKLIWLEPDVLLVFVVVGIPLLLLFVVVVLMLLWSAIVALVGGLMPSVRVLSRLTCMTATST